MVGRIVIPQCILQSIQEKKTESTLYYALLSPKRVLTSTCKGFSANSSCNCVGVRGSGPGVWAVS